MGKAGVNALFSLCTARFVQVCEKTTIFQSENNPVYAVLLLISVDVKN